MSKRFGRNQKRRMREEMTRLQRQSYADSVKAFNLQSRMVSWAKSMKSYVGTHHPLNEEVERIMLQRCPHLQERYRFMAPVKLSTLLDQSLNYLDVAQEYIQTVLHVVSIRRDEIRPSIIAELVSPDKQCFYAIDEDFLNQGRKDSKFVHWLSDELAIKLASHISSV
jgi:hypothetical protein